MYHSKHKKYILMKKLFLFLLIIASNKDIVYAQRIPEKDITALKAEVDKMSAKVEAVLRLKSNADLYTSMTKDLKAAGEIKDAKTRAAALANYRKKYVIQYGNI